MAGLLGDDINDPRTMAILQFAGALGGQRDRGFGGLLSGLNAGGQEYISSLARAKKAAQEEEFRKAQIQEMQAQAQQRLEVAKQAQAQAQRQASFMRALNQYPVNGTQAASFPGGPTHENAARIGSGSPQSIDLAALAQQFPDQIDVIKKLAESRDFGRPEVARTIKGMVNGREQEQQFDKFGRPVGAGMEQYRAPIQTDEGGRISFRDAYNPAQTVATVGKSNSPDALLSANTAMRGQNMTDARGREQNAISMQNGKIPPGYRLKMDGTMEAIPGGPADIKAGEFGAKQEARKAAAVSSANSVLDTVKEAKSMVGLNTAGIGGLAAAVPMTEARDLAAKLETIKANLGFDRLQEMRQNSPTGGALGTVAVQELTALQSTVSSLDQKQTPKQLADSLTKIEKHYGNWLRVVGGAEDSGPTKPATSGAATLRWNPKTGTFDMIGG